MKYLLSTIIIIASLTFTGQKSKIKESSFKVYGVCGMCEERIENALDIVGIRSAEWDSETLVLKIVFNTSKISLDEIHQICADIGHSTDKVKTTEEAYNNLHHCCKYKESTKCKEVEQ